LVYRKQTTLTHFTFIGISQADDSNPLQVYWYITSRWL